MTTQTALVATLADPAVPSQSALPSEFLTLQLGAETYGIDILQVQEIRGYEAPTHINGAPASMRGVLDLRGVIVPVIDLRLLMAMPARFDALTVTVILNLPGRTMGVVVDSVADVLELIPDEIRPAPAFNGAINAGHIRGLGTVGQGADARMLILLDIERLIGPLTAALH